MLACSISILIYSILSLEFTTVSGHTGGIKASLFSYSSNLFSFHYISNTLIPTVLIVFPHLYFIKKKEILDKFQINNNFILIYIIFILFGIFAGGAGNAGRYMIFLLPISCPLLNFLICNIASKIIKK